MAHYTANYDEDDPAYIARRDGLINILSDPNSNPLPADLILPILEHAGYLPRLIRPSPTRNAVTAGSHPASIPPSDGTSPFMKSLPSELRRKIFACSLPSREAEFQPVCADGDNPKLGSLVQEPIPNCASDLMTLNKIVKHEVATVLYGERIFAVHIHQGVKHGGIECINSGRQPLQYKTANDMRFDRFKSIEEFGFHRLKKLHITIFHEAASEVAHRHIALNTYYMNLAMCLLLKRDTTGDHLNPKRTTYVSIDFATSDKENGHPFSWLDSTGQPRSTSIHRCSDIELVLRPFAVLTGVHNVHIKLPDNLDQHASTSMFVNSLVASMMSLAGGMFNTDDLDHKIETAKEALHDYVLKQLYGGKGNYEIEKITDDELMQDAYDPDADNFDSDYEMDDSHADPRNQDFSGWLGKMDDEQEESARAAKEAESIVERVEAEQEVTEELIVLFERKKNPYGTGDYLSNKPHDISAHWTEEDEAKLLSFKTLMGRRCFEWVANNLLKLKMKKAMGGAVNYKDALDDTRSPKKKVEISEKFWLKSKQPGTSGYNPFAPLSDSANLDESLAPIIGQQQAQLGQPPLLSRRLSRREVGITFPGAPTMLLRGSARVGLESLTAESGKATTTIASIPEEMTRGTWSLVTEEEGDPFKDI